MAIEPIKGFYLHDEKTNTDGVAKYDASHLEGLDANRLNGQLGFSKSVSFSMNSGSSHSSSKDKIYMSAPANTNVLLSVYLSPANSSIGCQFWAIYADGTEERLVSGICERDYIASISKELVSIGATVGAPSESSTATFSVSSSGEIYETMDGIAREWTLEKVDKFTNCPFTLATTRIDPQTGVTYYAGNQTCTDYIECSEGETVTVHGRSTWYQGAPLTALIAFYDEFKQLIVSYAKFSDTETSNTTGTITEVAPENTAYVRMGSQPSSDFYAQIYNVTSNIEKIDKLVKGEELSTDALRLYVGKIVVKANANHSSSEDQVVVNIDSGTNFIVEVDGNITSAQIYAYYSDETNERLVMGKYYNGEAKKDIKYIGLFVSSSYAVETEIVKIRVYTEDGIYGMIAQARQVKGSSLSTTVCNKLPSDLSSYGVDSGYASKMYDAIQGWMGYCAGDYSKIPFIVHTDQHGRLIDTRKGLFDLLSLLVQWGNVSAIFNLGDTVTDHWGDDDTFSDPLLRNSELEAATRCLSSVPKDKQINVFGNHDTWYQGSVSTPVDGVLPSLQYINPYFRPNLKTKKFGDNSGLQVVYDDVFNVKYLVIPSWDYADKQGEHTGYPWYWINQSHLEKVVAEMTKNDGYDLVLISHVPLQMGSNGAVNPITNEPYVLTNPIYLTHYNPYLLDLWNARKNKTSGSVSADGVSVSFDFTNCETECLCALAGHTHADGVEYINDSANGLLQISFDWFDDDTIHFGVIDRENNKIKCWKISGSEANATWEKPFDNAT